jgi:hypothetical protein
LRYFPCDERDVVEFLYSEVVISNINFSKIQTLFWRRWMVASMGTYQHLMMAPEDVRSNIVVVASTCLG